MRPGLYVFQKNGICRGCHREIEWWRTPALKTIPMDPMPEGTSKAVAHWTTCPDANRFRGGARPASAFRDVCAVDRFLLKAKAHSDELGKQMAELMSIDLAQARNAPAFQQTLLNARNSASQVYNELSQGLDAAKKGGCL
jgi:hypothetical protein